MKIQSITLKFERIIFELFSNHDGQFEFYFSHLRILVLENFSNHSDEMPMECQKPIKKFKIALYFL